MKVRLLRDARINYKAGEIVEVSPSQFNFLVSVGSAELLDEGKTVETPEESVKAETPEKKKPAKRTTKK